MKNDHHKAFGRIDSCAYFNPRGDGPFALDVAVSANVHESPHYPAHRIYVGKIGGDEEVVFGGFGMTVGQTTELIRKYQRAVIEVTAKCPTLKRTQDTGGEVDAVAMAIADAMDNDLFAADGLVGQPTPFDRPTGPDGYEHDRAEYRAAAAAAITAVDAHRAALRPPGEFDNAAALVLARDLVQHIANRLVEDPNFRHTMWFASETFIRLMNTMSVMFGKPTAEIEAYFRLEVRRHREPDIVVAKTKLEKIEQLIEFGLQSSSHDKLLAISEIIRGC